MSAAMSLLGANTIESRLSEYASQRKFQIKILVRSSCSILKQLLSSFRQMSRYISTISLQEVSSRSMYSILAASKPLHGLFKLVPHMKLS